MRQANLLVAVSALLILTALPSLAQEGVARLTLSPEDAQRGVTAQMSLDAANKLTGDQRAAIASNPLIDPSVEPLALADFTIREGNSEVNTAKKPFALAGKASLMIPYKADPKPRPAQLDAFVWDGEAKAWRAVGYQFERSADEQYRIVTDTQVYPKLNALLARPSRLGRIAVFQKRPERGVDPELTSGIKTSKLGKMAKGIDVKENKGYYFITTPKTEIILCKATGLVYRYGVREPIPFYYTADGRKNLNIYLVNKDRNIAGTFDVCRSMDFSHAAFEGEDYLVIDIDLGSSQDFPETVAKAHLQYRIGPEMTFIRPEVTITADDPSQFEVGASQNYDPSNWQRQILPILGSATERPVERKCIFRYSDLIEDETKPTTEEKFIAANNPEGNLRAFAKANATTSTTEFLTQAAMPWSILEGDDCFMMYGQMDINTKLLMAPNRMGGIPAFQWQPKGAKQGKIYAFEYFMRFFPRPENTVTDVCKWYATKRYSTNPLSKDYTTFPEGDVIKKHLGRGNFGDSNYHTNPDATRAIGETYPATGIWYRIPEGGNLTTLSMTTPEIMHRELGEMKAKGRYIFPYTRQIRGWYAYHEDRVPLRSWIFRGKGGNPFSYDKGSTVRIEDQIWDNGVLPESVWPLLGITKKWDASMLGVHDDFGNPDFVDWFIKDHCDFMAAFPEVDGFYYDMGWSTHLSPTMGANDIWHGELKCIAEIAKFGAKLTPPRVMVTNGGSDSPVMQWVAAAYIHEGGLGASKLSIDTAKFTRVSFSNIIYDGQWADVYGKKDAPRIIVQSAFRNLAAGITFASGGVFERNNSLYHEYLDFSGWVTPMPLIYEDDALLFIPQDKALTGTVWADKDDLCLAIYNDSDQPKPVRALMDQNLIRKYGYAKPIAPTFKLIGFEGLAQGASGFRVTQDVSGWPAIEGTLPPRTLLMAR